MNGLYSETAQEANAFDGINAAQPNWDDIRDRDWGKLASEASPKDFALAFTLDSIERMEDVKARLTEYVNALENYADEVEQARDHVYATAASVDLTMAAVAPWHFDAVLRIRALYTGLIDEVRELGNRVAETYRV